MPISQVTIDSGPQHYYVTQEDTTKGNFFCISADAPSSSSDLGPLAGVAVIIIVLVLVAVCIVVVLLILWR